jgi:hypothetical protein
METFTQTTYRFYLPVSLVENIETYFETKDPKLAKLLEEYQECTRRYKHLRNIAKNGNLESFVALKQLDFLPQGNFEAEFDKVLDNQEFCDTLKTY